MVVVDVVVCVWTLPTDKLVVFVLDGTEVDVNADNELVGGENGVNGPSPVLNTEVKGARVTGAKISLSKLALLSVNKE